MYGVYFKTPQAQTGMSFGMEYKVLPEFSMFGSMSGSMSGSIQLVLQAMNWKPRVFIQTWVGFCFCKQDIFGSNTSFMELSMDLSEMESVLNIKQ